MLLTVITLYLFQGFFNADAAPISIFFPRQTNTDPGVPQECLCPNTRSQWDIVWSCLATIFVCTWVSVHPNMPALGEPWWKKTLRRLYLMVWSIIAPEVIILWATRQWAGAQQLVAKYKEYGWTMSHGYFIQMGGFMLYENDKPIGVLSPEQLDILIKEAKVAMPQITEEEIQDRSKSDSPSKALVVIQTTWFISQCLTRRVQGLTTTELELATLAFAALNGIMYMFWWSKPLDVQTAVRVNVLPSRPQNVPVDAVIVQADVVMDQMQSSQVSQEPSSSALEITTIPSIMPVNDQELEGSSKGSDGEPPTVDYAHYVSINSSASFIRPRDQTWISHSILKGEIAPGLKTSHFGIYGQPANGMKAVKTRIEEAFNSKTVDKGAMGVPIFYAFGTANESEEGWEVLPMLISVPFVGIVFGAIHCAGWNFSFPSLIEANIWRISSASITSVPAMVLVVEVYVVFLAGYSFLPKPLENSRVRKMQDFLKSFMFIVGVGLLLLYIIARLALLVVALTTEEIPTRLERERGEGR